MTSPAPFVLDLFAGPGGWDEGIRALGLAPLGIEWDADACATATAAGHLRQQADVADVDPRALVAAYGPMRGLIASPPCQGFSLAGKGKGREDTETLLAALTAVRTLADLTAAMADLRATVADYKSVLALEPLRFALAATPSWCAWEQVPAVLPLWEASAAVLRRIGYSVATGVAQAEAYGVPQTRKRAILVARAPWLTRTLGPAALPTPTHSRYFPHDPAKLDAGVPRWVTIREALGWADDEDVLAIRSQYNTGGRNGAGAYRSVDQPAATVTSKVDRNRWVYSGAGEAAQRTAGLRPRELDQPAHTVTGAGTAYVYRASNQARAARRPVDAPAPTVMFGHASNKVEWMPAELAADVKASGRRVTIGEAAVLQSFPADYPWQGNQSSRYLQVGNAVPPLLARHVIAAAAGLEAAVDAQAAA